MRESSDRRAPALGETLALARVLGRRLAPPTAEWLDRAVDEMGASGGERHTSRTFTAAGRRFGCGPLALGPDDVEELRAAGVSSPAGGWALDEAGRVVVLAHAAARLPVDMLEALVDDCYSHGDARERQAVLRALPLLPHPARFRRVGVDACRSHVQPVFEAIACENPFPAAHFPELNFNQMVLKALFTGVALARIEALDHRLNPELARMARDYAAERRAAGRSVPPDIARVTGAHATDANGDS